MSSITAFVWSPSLVGANVTRSLSGSASGASWSARLPRNQRSESSPSATLMMHSVSPPPRSFALNAATGLPTGGLPMRESQSVTLASILAASLPGLLYALSSGSHHTAPVSVSATPNARTVGPPKMESSAAPQTDRAPTATQRTWLASLHHPAHVIMRSAGRTLRRRMLPSIISDSQTQSASSSATPMPSRCVDDSSRPTPNARTHDGPTGSNHMPGDARFVTPS